MVCALRVGRVPVGRKDAEVLDFACVLELSFSHWIQLVSIEARVNLVDRIDPYTDQLTDRVAEAHTQRDHQAARRDTSGELFYVRESLAVGPECDPADAPLRV